MSSPIKISIIADAGRAVAGFRQASTAAETLGTKAGKVGAFLGKAAFAGALIGVAALGAGMKAGITDAVSYEGAQKQASAALKVNGDVAGQTLGSLKSRAASIETLTGATQDENDVLDAQSRLLRTGVSGNKAFGNATLAAANLAAAGHQNISASAKGLAKALQDPTKAAGALRKANVTLTEAQQKQIEKFVESGDKAKAQAIVIGAVNTQLAGQAAAAGQGVGASFAIIKDTLQDTARDLAFKLLPAFATFATFLKANLPDAIAFVSTAFGKISTVVQAILPSFDTLKSAFSTLVTIFQNPVFQIVAGAFAAGGIALGVIAAATAIATIAMTAFASVTAFAAGAMAVLTSPVFLVVAALALLVGALVYAYRNSETFRDTVNAAFRAVQAVASAVWTAIQAVVGAVIAAVTGYIAAYKAVVLAVWSAISAAASAVWAAIQAVVGAVVLAITAYINVYKSVVTGVWAALRTAAAAAWSAIQALISAAITAAGVAVRALLAVAQAVWSGILAAGRAAFAAVSAVVASAVAGVKAVFGLLPDSVQAVFGRIVSAVTDKMNAVKNKVSEVLSSIKGAITSIDLYGAGLALIQRLGAGVAAGAQAVVDKVQGMANKIKGLLPGSPIKYGPLLGWNNTGPTGPGGQLMGRLAAGISGQDSVVQAALSNALTGLTGDIGTVDAMLAVGGPTGGSAAVLAPQRVVLPQASQITNAEQGRALLEQLQAYSRLYGALDLVIA